MDEKKYILALPGVYSSGRAVAYATNFTRPIFSRSLVIGLVDARAFGARIIYNK